MPTCGPGPARRTPDLIVPVGYRRSHLRGASRRSSTDHGFRCQHRHTTSAAVAAAAAACANANANANANTNVFTAAAKIDPELAELMHTTIVK